MSFLVGTNIGGCRQLVRQNPDTLRQKMLNLQQKGKDRIANVKEEVYIFLLPTRNA